MTLTEEVQKHDVLLSYPYQSIRPFIDDAQKGRAVTRMSSPSR